MENEKQKVLVLSDYDVEALYRGNSVVLSNGILITFEKGSKRYCEVA